MAALVGRIVVRPGPHRIVMVARIFRIDGDEREWRAGRCARADRPALRALASSNDVLRKHGRNAMGVDGDQADGAWANPCCRCVPPRARGETRRALRPMGSQSTSSLFFAPAASRLSSAYSPRALRSIGHDAEAVRCLAQHAEHAFGPLALQPPDDPGFVAFAAPFQPRQNARAGAQRARLPCGGVTMIAGGSSLDSQFSGRASNSPSLSMPVISSTAISGNSPALVSRAWRCPRSRLRLPVRAAGVSARCGPSL